MHEGVLVFEGVDAWRLASSQAAFSIFKVHSRACTCAHTHMHIYTHIYTHTGQQYAA